MRQREAVLQVDFADDLALAQSAQEFLPIGNPGIRTKRIGDLLNRFYPRCSGKTEQNMLREQRSSNSNHMALPLQRSLAPRISAKVRCLGKRSGSFSFAGRTMTASLG